MGKFNYSSAKWLAEMIITDSKILEKSLQKIEEDRKSILNYAQRLLSLLEEAQREQVDEKRLL